MDAFQTPPQPFLFFSNSLLFFPDLFEISSVLCPLFDISPLLLCIMRDNRAMERPFRAVCPSRIFELSSSSSWRDPFVPLLRPARAPIVSPPPFQALPAVCLFFLSVIVGFPTLSPSSFPHRQIPSVTISLSRRPLHGSLPFLFIELLGLFNLPPSPALGTCIAVSFLNRIVPLLVLPTRPPLSSFILLLSESFFFSRTGHTR